MQVLAKRMKALREGVKLSQAKVAALVGTTQASINRYENEIGLPPHKTLLWYADYFDVCRLPSSYVITYLSVCCSWESWDQNTFQ